METLSYRHKAQERAAGSKSLAIIGVVASGNLEVLVPRPAAQEATGPPARADRNRRDVVGHVSQRARSPRARWETCPTTSPPVCFTRRG